MKLSIYFLFVLMISGCTTSNHNLSDGPNPLGGGFFDKQIGDGFFWIVAQTNFSPWSDFKAAHEMFNSRATKLCGSNNFNSINIKENEFKHIPGEQPPLYIISKVSGYIVCEPAKYTPEEIEKLILQSMRLST